MRNRCKPATDPTLISSWLQIHPDNTVAIRTGVADLGQGAVGTGFRQIVAEELRLPFEAVTELIAGDTDSTPDGGIAAGYMNKATQEHFMGGIGIHPDSPFGRNALNLQKVAAYTYAALLKRASAFLAAPIEQLTASGGAVSAGTQRVTYAELVTNRPLDERLELTGTADGFGIVVLGTPPVVPVSDYRVLGTSCRNPRIPDIVRGTHPWVSSMRLPGMLHARMVHPRTLGSTLVSLGELSPERYPGAQVIVRGNLVAVTSRDEWEAICAAQDLADSTVWSDWSGLPRSEELVEALIETDWSQVPPRRSSDNEAAVEATLASATLRLEAHFAVPFYKHAPISPEISLADVRNDGSVTFGPVVSNFAHYRQSLPPCSRSTLRTSSSISPKGRADSVAQRGVMRGLSRRQSSCPRRAADPFAFSGCAKRTLRGQRNRLAISVRFQ